MIMHSVKVADDLFSESLSRENYPTKYLNVNEIDFQIGCRTNF